MIQNTLWDSSQTTACKNILPVRKVRKPCEDAKRINFNDIYILGLLERVHNFSN